MFISRSLAILMISAAVIAARAAELDPDVSYVLRTDGTIVPVTKITRDEYLMVSGVLKGGAAVNVKGCDVVDVLYAGRDTNFLSAIEKRDAGRFTLAAMYFQHAAESLPHAAWVGEQCNFGIAEALYQYGAFSGFKGRAGVNYAAPSHYYQLALHANPKSRYSPQILSRLVICLAEEGEFDKSSAAMKDAEAKLKAYRDESVRIDAKFVPQADRAQAQLALAGAVLAERKATAGKGRFEDARDAYHAALARCETLSDLLADAADGELRTLIALNDYSSARIAAERWIERLRGNAGLDEAKRTILASAYLALGKCHFADATALKARGQDVSAADTFANARWAFLHVVAEYFDNDAQVAAAHYFSGLCYDRLAHIEVDAATKARREWGTVVEKFAKSAFKELAEKELTR
jgi:hypothetical protein